LRGGAAALAGFRLVGSGRGGCGRHRLLDLGAGRRVHQQLVGERHLLEDAVEASGEGSELAPEVAVGVEVLRELEVGPLDDALFGVATHTEDLVVGPLELPLEVEDPLLQLDRDPEALVDVAGLRLAIGDHRARRRLGALLVLPRRAVALDGHEPLVQPAFEAAVDPLGFDALPRRVAVDPRKQKALLGADLPPLLLPARHQARHALLLGLRLDRSLHRSP